MENLDFLPPFIESWLTTEIIHDSLRIALLIIISVPLIHLMKKWAQAYFTKKLAAHYGMLSGKVIKYLGYTILIITILNQLGISLTPLLGAAGIVGVALGFASQTSVSNIISGLFLIAEQPFKIDDIITIGNTSGFVLSIDTLSVKIRTFDNKFVRIPNESIIKQEVINNTRFPIRRFNANVSVAYGEDIAIVKDILMDIAEKNSFCLSEPKPLIIFDKFGTSSIDLLFLVWAEKKHWLDLKNSINEDVKRRFDEEGIEIPFPHVSIYTGKHSKPLPIATEKQFSDSQPQTIAPKKGFKTE
jgi:small-conductance mechanosensitive channel